MVLPVYGNNFVMWWRERFVPEMERNFAYIEGMLDKKDELSLADFLMGMITKFDLADEASPYYDENLAPDLEQFLSAFKGLRIVSEDPLVIEHYGDNPSLDAESSVYGWWPGNESGTAYNRGDAAWVMRRNHAASHSVPPVYSRAAASARRASWRIAL